MTDLRHAARIPTGSSYLLKHEKNGGQPVRSFFFADIWKR
jgi:hypothetical protein